MRTRIRQRQNNTSTIVGNRKEDKLNRKIIVDKTCSQNTLGDA